MDKTIVSRNNGFLTSIGVISKGQQKGISPVGAELGRALEYDVTSDIENCWRKITTDIEFFKNLVSSVRIRRGMELSALRAHVAYSAGQSKSPGVLTGAGTVVEILKLAGALKGQDGKLIATDVVPPRPTEISTPLDIPLENQKTLEVGSSATLHDGVAGLGITVSIQVQIVCKPDELDGLPEKLQTLLAGLQKSNISETDEN
jgi:hypothetical protein